MKTFIAFLCSLSLQAFAGQVISLQPGQTLPLSNGDVVACMGASPVPTPAPQVTVNCTYYSGLTSTNGISLPPFKGSGTGPDKSSATDEAQRAALQRCHNYTAGMSFVLDGHYVDPCTDDGTIPGAAFICN
jgi:hypothetical protein